MPLRWLIYYFTVTLRYVVTHVTVCCSHAHAFTFVATTLPVTVAFTFYIADFTFILHVTLLRFTLHLRCCRVTLLLVVDYYVTLRCFATGFWLRCCYVARLHLHLPLRYVALILLRLRCGWLHVYGWIYVRYHVALFTLPVTLHAALPRLRYVAVTPFAFVVTLIWLVGYVGLRFYTDYVTFAFTRLRYVYVTICTVYVVYVYVYRFPRCSPDYPLRLLRWLITVIVPTLLRFTGYPFPVDWIPDCCGCGSCSYVDYAFVYR